MSEHERVEHARRKMIRYRILKILDAARPLPFGEGSIRQVLVDVDLGASQDDVRKALQYLDDRRFVCKSVERGLWMARLLPAGVDFLDDPDAEDKGIAKPESMG